MKQIIIGKNVDYNKVTSDWLDDGSFVITKCGDNTALTDKATENFTITCGRGKDKMPIVFPEVDVKSLQVTKATYQAGAKFASTITVPTPVVGNVYTVLISKLGVVFNERNNWTFTTIAKDTTAANVAKALIDEINANTSNLGVTATNSGGAITITAVNVGDGYRVQGADALMGVAITAVTDAKKPVLDKAYVQDLASRCAAGKGFNYTDNPEIYPGYPEEVINAQYVMYTLRFAVPRVSAKQRDEVVWQTVHLVMPSSAKQVTTIEYVLGVTAKPTEPAESGPSSD